MAASYEKFYSFLEWERDIWESFPYTPMAKIHQPKREDCALIQEGTHRREAMLIVSHFVVSVDFDPNYTSWPLTSMSDYIGQMDNLFRMFICLGLDLAAYRQVSSTPPLALTSVL